MRTSIWIAIGLFAVVAAWLASGFFIDGGEDEEAETQAAEPQPTLVEVRTSTAEPVPQYLYAQGVAQPYRTADVVSSAGGTLAEVQVMQGEVVEAGTELAQVRLEARESQLQSARSQVESLEADLEAVRELEAEGFATQSRVRELESQLENARATLESVQADIRDTTVEAPISGIVSDVYVNSGETATAGTAIARIVDNAPLRVTLNISQRDVGRVDVGRMAVVSFATGELAKGRVCFVAPAADPQTRTFRVEIRVPNEERNIPSVVSSEIRLQTGEARAHFISPAILSLSDAGVLGVKSVGEDNIVRFHAVEVVRTGTEGIWVGGLPDELRLITVGQGFVREGERVRVGQEQEGDEEALTVGNVRDAALPTATVEMEDFGGAENLPAPPPAEELCAGGAASTVLTSSVPSTSSGAAAGGAQLETQPGGSTTGTRTSPGGAVGSGAETGSGTLDQSSPPPPSIGPISPGIPSPPIGGSGQQQGGTPEPQGGAAGGSAGGENGGAGAGASPGAVGGDP